MNLSKNNFSKGDTRFLGADGKIRPAKVYTYETKSKLYDIYIIEGKKFVRINMGKLGVLISDWHPIHYAIARHFHLA
ncbi:hypothetical protein LCGC14_2864860 [marine sediment metagenome]|uniref:Uncharacterized protein n=1 Tax=marine sediment metagenome TaxID=412755 RepID=A0A0F9AVR2_9ZZZZ